MLEERGEEYRRRVCTLDRAGVVRLWEALQTGQVPEGWPPGKLLEYLLLRAFELEGARVTWPFVVHDRLPLEQIDGVAYFDGMAFLLECKHQRGPADVEPILKLKAQLVRRPRATVGALFCTGGFTEPALALARLLPPANVLLWDGREMDMALRHGGLTRGMQKKLEFAIEQGALRRKLERPEDFR